MNILITSAGRRSYMADYFRKALDGKGLVFATNSQMSPALGDSDGYFITPIIYSDEYIPFLLEKCRTYSIDLIVSLFDIDLPVLAGHRADFEAAGTRLAVSDPDMLEICRDKLKLGRFLREHGIASPRSFCSVAEAAAALEDGSVSWPLFVKPRFGMGSIGVLTAFDLKELEGAFSICRRAVRSSYLRYESAAAGDEAVLIQTFEKGTEYGLDIISDLDGRYVNTVIRKKCAMRSGETDEAVILGPEAPEYGVLMDTAKKLAACLKPRGLIDVDVLMDTSVPEQPGKTPEAAVDKPGKMAQAAVEKPGKTPEAAVEQPGPHPVVIDVNARFGGGYPFSHVAGADVPRAYVLWAQGRNAEADACCRAEAGVHAYKDIVPRVYERRETYASE